MLRRPASAISRGFAYAARLGHAQSRRCQKFLARPNKKRSLLRLTRPTVCWSADRTLFFDFASDTFWRRTVRGQLRRRSQSRERSRRVKIKQREGDLDCWPRLLSRDPGARRYVRRYSIDGTRFLSAATHRASFSLLATCCFNFETDMSVFFIFLADSFLPSANQLFLVYGDASGRVCQLPRGQEVFAENVFSTWTGMPRVAGCAWR